MLNEMLPAPVADQLKQVQLVTCSFEKQRAVVQKCGEQFNDASRNFKDIMNEL